MKHLKIEAIIEKRFEKIGEAFDKARLHFQEDDIRIFRVKVKKLSAFLQLIDKAKTHGHSIELSQHMVKLNHLFGTIRSLQMQQNYVQDRINEKNISSPDTYLKFLSDQILQHMVAAGQQVKGIASFKKEEVKLLGLLPKELSRKDMLQFVRSEGDIIEALFAPVFLTDKSLHNARKHLKNLLYIAPYTDLEIAALSPYKLLSSFEAIDEFTKLLGKFQDMDTVLGSLYLSVPKIDIDENEKINLRRLEQIWVEAREVFRVQIYDQLQLITAANRTAGPLELV
jgi:hypothetical protein